MRKTAILAAAAALLMPGIAHSQAEIRVQPLSVDVRSPSQASSITLQNNGKEDLTLQMRVFAWSQVDGRDRLVPATDVVASPPVARIPAGSNFTVRVARTGGPVPAGAEASYRLWVDELPPSALLRDEGGLVDVRLRFDLPVFFRGAGTSPAVSWDVRQSGSDLVVEATNSGSQHARIEGLEVRNGVESVSFGKGLNGYVLANSSRRWTAPAEGNAQALAGGDATVVTGGDGGNEPRQTVALAD